MRAKRVSFKPGTLVTWSKYYLSTQQIVKKDVEYFITLNDGTVWSLDGGKSYYTPPLDMYFERVRLKDALTS